MGKPTMILISVLFISLPTQLYFPFNFVIWNVGQGSWSTFIDPRHCYHFDMGGEKFNFKKIEILCSRKVNKIFLTHLDWDHISFIKSFRNHVETACLFYPKHKKDWMKDIPPCLEIEQTVEILSHGNDKLGSNASSIVYLVEKTILISGDAPIKEERKWFKKVPRNIRILLLGHHGSQTSTSVELIQWAQPRTAIASARKSKYGHPHWKVLKKLKKHGIPVLTTENQGDIFIQL